MVNPQRPDTLDHALEIRSSTGALPFAGGTDLMVRQRAKNGLPPAFDGPLLFLDAVDELRSVEDSEEDLRLGATLPLADISGESGVPWRDDIPLLLRESALDVAAPALRNRATLGGNLCNASPAADTLPGLYVLGATIDLASSSAGRSLTIADFVTGPGRTRLGHDELVVGLTLPKPFPQWSYWRKVGTRRANALSKLSVAAGAWFGADGLERGVLAFGAVAPKVVTVEFSGPLDTEAVLEDCRRVVVPIDDQRSTARYRRATALKLAAEALARLAEDLNDKGTPS